MAEGCGGMWNTTAQLYIFHAERMTSFGVCRNRYLEGS